MFVFKAAVVGAGTMGGEIAHVIASAGIPVVLQDIDSDRGQAGAATGRSLGQGQAGVAKARSLWQAQLDGGKLDAAECERRAGLVMPATDYAGFADVDLAIE